MATSPDGAIYTVLGTAAWSAGTFSEDGEMIEELYLYVSHPTQDGTLILTSVCPPEEAAATARLAQIEKLLEHVR